VNWFANSNLLGNTAEIKLSPMSALSDIKATAGGLVVSNPGILGGTPLFKGTRLPVQTLFDYLAEGLSVLDR